MSKILFFYITLFSVTTLANENSKDYSELYNLVYELDLDDWWYGDDGIECNTGLTITDLSVSGDQITKVFFQIQQDYLFAPGCVERAFDCSIEVIPNSKPINLNQITLSCSNW